MSLVVHHRKLDGAAGRGLVETGFEVVYRREFARVVGVAYAATGSRADAHDVAQETFTRAHARWEELSVHPNIAGWLTLTAMNLARSTHRRRRVARRLRPELSQRSPQTRDTSARAIADAFWREVAVLPKRMSEVVILHYLEDRPISEIGEMLGIADGTVKATLAAARGRLKRSLGAKGWLDR